MPRTVPGQDSTAKRYLETIADLATPYKLDEAGTLVEAEYPPKQSALPRGYPFETLPYALGWIVPGSFSALYLKIRSGASRFSLSRAAMD